MKWIILLLLTPITSLACNSSLFVEEILIDTDSKQYQETVLLTGEEGQQALCQKNSDWQQTIHLARKRLKFQNKFLSELKQQTKIPYVEWRHYSNLFNQLSDNLDLCELEIATRQNSEIPNYKNRMEFYIRKNGVSKIYVKDASGKKTYAFTSHIQWLGKLMTHESVHLCESTFYRL